MANYLIKGGSDYGSLIWVEEGRIALSVQKGDPLFGAEKVCPKLGGHLTLVNRREYCDADAMAKLIAADLRLLVEKFPYFSDRITIELPQEFVMEFNLPSRMSVKDWLLSIAQNAK